MPADTTVLVYIVGSDLERRDSQATENLKEMMLVGSQAGRLNVVVQTGGANKPPLAPPTNPSDMHPDNIDWTHVQRYLVNHLSLARIADLGAESIDDPALNMGSGVTLGEFLDWGVATYPARQYLVVLWDHGGGVNGGVGLDEVTNGSILSVPTIVETLNAVAQAREVEFELVGFDACFMATMEVASGLAANANYLVASEDVEQGTGWDWSAFLGYVRDHPTATGKEIGIAIADGFAAKQQESDFTLSVTDLSVASELSDATGVLVGKLARYVDRATFGTRGWMAIAKARALSIDWGTSAVYGGSTDLVDAADLAGNLVAVINETIAPDAALTAAGEAFVAAVERAVVYDVAGGTDIGATGLTFYFPSVLKDYPEKAYTQNTSVNGVSYFSPIYTASWGFAKGYFDFYFANPAALQANVTMSEVPEDPLEAIVDNDHDTVLAARKAASCTYYTVPPFPPYVETEKTGPCYDAAQVVTGVKSATTNEWLVTFAYDGAWPRMSDASNAYPIVLVPDQYSATKFGHLNGYLVPAWKRLVDPDTLAVSYQAGYLVVDEVQPVVPGPRSLKASSFRVNATIPDKGEKIENDTYALGVYVEGSDGYAFNRSNRMVAATNGVITMGTTTLSGGSFGYILTDLTGRVSLSGVVPYVAP
ncbi:MAG TPA: clostripain-related cysteine peptidase [Anaeromyxobacteraceae bacterium]|nr:clostripain-related cysteine peptidase [Anaeromyxobacteraceae bacterium]